MVVSERRACMALGQHRSTQRKVPRGPEDEKRLRADIIELARQYGNTCRGLENYTRDMNKCLAEDLSERQREEDKNKIDLVKNVTFIIAVPAAFMTAAKNGFAHGRIDIDQAAGAGFVVSNTVVFHKSLGKAFSQFGRALVRTPQQIRDSFLLYYVKESFKGAVVESLSVAKNSAKNAPMRARKVIGRFIGNKPKR